jgi:predicted anti-sigma-YlaC factor YlaD
MNNTGWFRPAYVRATLIGGGILYIFSGVTLLFTPAWFLESVGTFPPFNRHYMGDAGSFVLALGIGLLLAAREPMRQRLMVAVGLIGTLVHTVNHGYGDLALAELPTAEVARDLLPLVVYAVLLVVAYAMVVTPQPTSAPPSQRKATAGSR